MKEIRNDGGRGEWNNENNPLCSAYPHTDINYRSVDSLNSTTEWLKNILEEDE